VISVIKCFTWLVQLFRTHGFNTLAARVLRKPLAEIDLRAQEVRRLRGRAVKLVVEPDHRRRDFLHLERLVELLGLADRRPQVIDARHQHRGRFHVARVHER